MSKQEEQMIDGSTNRQFVKKNRLPELKSSNKVTCLSDNDVIDLFAGDAFRIADGGIALHPYTMDRKAAQETIRRIKDELKNYEKVFTAHYGLMGNDASVIG